MKMTLDTVDLLSRIDTNFARTFTTKLLLGSMSVWRNLARPPDMTESSYTQIGSTIEHKLDRLSGSQQDWGLELHLLTSADIASEPRLTHGKQFIIKLRDGAGDSDPNSPVHITELSYWYI
jgi:hypothetical protein